MARSGRVVLAVALIAMVSGSARYAHVTFDDAYISFRYAENLAHGNGLVFNVGERVEGYSNFLWTLLMALPVALHVDRYELGLLILAKAFGFACAVATVAVSARFGALESDARRSAAWPLAAWYLATCIPFLFWSVGALETPLVSLLLTLAIYLHLREQASLAAARTARPWSYLALLLAALTRPEPLLFGALFGALRLWHVARVARGRPWLARELAYSLSFIAPYAAFIGWRDHYYGQLVPNTYFAKMHADPLTTERGASYVASAWEHLSLTALLGFGGACFALARRLRYPLLLAACGWALQLAMVLVEGGDWMPGYRMLVPGLPFVALAVQEVWLAAGDFPAARFELPSALPGWLIRAAWIQRWNRGLRTARAARWLHTLARASVLSILAAGTLGCLGELDRIPTLGSALLRPNLDYAVHLKVARWMKRELREPGLLATGEAGTVPYYTKLPVLDLLGLMDPHIAHLPGEMHRKFDADYVFERKPEYLLLLVTRSPSRLSSDQFYARCLLADPRFANRYTLRRDFGRAILYQRTAVARH